MGSKYVLRKLHLAGLLVLLSLACVLQSALAASETSARDAIVAGVHQVGGGMLISRVDATRKELQPLIWGGPRATGGDRLGLQGTLPAPAWAGGYRDGRVAIWAAHEGFFGAGPDDKLDNDLFRQNLLTWLLGGGKRLGITAGHGEWLERNGFSIALRMWMLEEGIDFTDLPAPIKPAMLRDVDALIIGNPWERLSSTELAAVRHWVARGGGLLVLSLGWSWYGNHHDPEGKDYPVNQLGRDFGWKVLDGTINDPDAPNGSPGQPSLAVKPLEAYKPARVRILSSLSGGADQVKQLAAEQPADIFVVQGRYTALQLPTADWTALKSATRALELLDLTYETELELLGHRNKPYGGEMLWCIAADDPKGAYWMHSGNPIVFKQEAGREIVKSIDEQGYPGWGLLHEMGHDMVIDACGDLFAHSGTAEPWCNVFTVWAIRRNGWPERKGAYDEGHAYHAEAQPDFKQLRSNPWVLLGCLELIWSKYGWDGMQRFMSQAATDCASGRSAGDAAARTAYFVEQLSRAYGLDFAPLIEHWGFPVSDASRKLTSTYPPADITW